MPKQQKWTGKKVVWQWTEQEQEPSEACQNALIEHAQLYAPRQGNPFEFEVTILDAIALWQLWQMTGLESNTVGFWSKAL